MYAFWKAASAVNTETRLMARILQIFNNRPCYNVCLCCCIRFLRHFKFFESMLYLGMLGKFLKIPVWAAMGIFNTIIVFGCLMVILSRFGCVPGGSEHKHSLSIFIWLQGCHPLITITKKTIKRKMSWLNVLPEMLQFCKSVLYCKRLGLTLSKNYQ